MALPILHTDNKDLSMLQTTWGSQLNPLLAAPLNNGLMLENVILASGANVINHKLGRKLKGWLITRIRASATIYDTQDTNQRPNLTLNLTSSANVTVDIFVF